VARRTTTADQEVTMKPSNPRPEPTRGSGPRSAHHRPIADAGMATAEYAIATLAACGFAALLLALMRSDEVRNLLLGIIRRALSVVG
jgi:hypothetical protein